jgi:endonuclease G
MVDTQKVGEALRLIQERDRTLGEELERRLQTASNEIVFKESEASDKALAGLTPETIVLRTGRPVLAIRDNQVDIEIEEAESKVWRQRLIDAKSLLDTPIRGVGRIEVQGHRSYTWLGTGWLVRDDILVTNRHVAAEFTYRGGSGFQFRIGLNQQPMTARVDFLEELDSTASREFNLKQVLHVEDDNGPDLAFFRVEGRALSKPISLSEQGAQERDLVAAIGYPASDSRIPEQDLMARLFGNVYEKKRLAPGQIIGTSGATLLHDCSTLGGNSGSALIDLNSGKAVALHFAGRFLEANYAVPSSILAERLHQVERGARPRVPDGASMAPTTVPAPNHGVTVSFTVPLHVTVQLGDVVNVSTTTASTTVLNVQGLAPASPSIPTPSHSDEDAGEADFDVEGRPEDYLDREGYQASFLGDGLLVELPTIVRGKDDILRFPFNGNAEETVLRYHNFSVVMNRTRRMCFFSAVNIDGQLSRRSKRPGWLLDPRIPKEYQIKGECYGNAPKFSRGHMTRREDPAWGTAEEAQRGNADSMHVTNVVPQMQTFNAGIWLGLEDYALEHARDDDMRICVITGPVLRADDPTRFGIRIPVQFWKVIAFIHDQTNELSATAYSISQAKFLQTEEFVFGAYETHQRSLKWIEQAAGLSFGELSAHDRFGERESVYAGPLLSPTQIQW